MITFGLESRALAAALILCALLGYEALHWYKQAAIADARCDTRVAVQVGNENVATATDQHKADVGNITALQKQIDQLQSDARHAAAIKTTLQARLHDQQEVLDHALTTAKPGDCLHQPVPADLINSLHPGAHGSAKPPS